METIYLILVIVLFSLAISDLVVGVSNDAVNFLNSAIGSKAASFKTIMIIAGLGVLAGATFSSGMMEVARKGIFHPDMFYFKEVMIIFLAVMLTDVILLDVFNTMGLPTSTTVSIVFELLGAAVAVSLLKAIENPGIELHEYINTGKALAIIAGILFSVVIAFLLGAIAQYFTRLIFTFRYIKTLKYYGAIWGGIAITAITYFILIKGAKGSALITEEQHQWIQANAMQILAVSFVAWTIALQLISYLVKFNMLRLIVLVGTFALAMAFAGNDLVNFIGVPLAGFSSFQIFAEAGASDPGALLMEQLSGAVETPKLILLGAGIVMVITLWKSKKAKSVVTTTLDLSRQEEGEERFQSYTFSRAIVRAGRSLNEGVRKILPNSWLDKMEKRFTLPDKEQDTGVSFDLLRASVNLVIASIIISFATSLKLPLSTTYVTFMVAMGTSLSDKAWGRESAVYRISGVITVIGGWFFTALIAFTAAFIFAMIISFGDMIAIVLLIAVAIFFIIKTHALHKKRETEKEEREKQREYDSRLSNRQNILIQCNRTILGTLSSISKIYQDIIEHVSNEDRQNLKATGREMDTLRKSAKEQKENLYFTVNELEEHDIDSGHNYVQVVDYLRELTRSIRTIYDQGYTHVDNNHKTFTKEQKEELTNLANKLSDYLFDISSNIKHHNHGDLDRASEKNNELMDLVESMRKHQIKRIKKQNDSTKRSMLYLSILFETKNILKDTWHILKIQQRFIQSVDYYKELANNHNY
ncbi:MAG: inorganic phosphate transporter [Bacteroidales bacterium]|nr:inorganic phosphate transporter [Bacteroidales bacterium]MCF8336547.1 inorganic phosphate transporter [Bacteroidales bacterium]